MERALKKDLRELDQSKFIKMQRLSEGTPYYKARNLWKLENTYDRDNELIFSGDIIYTDSDNDSDME